MKEFDTNIITNAFDNYEVKEGRKFVDIIIRTELDREFAYKLSDSIATANGHATSRMFTSRSTLPIMWINK